MESKQCAPSFDNSSNAVAGDITMESLGGRQRGDAAVECHGRMRRGQCNSRHQHPKLWEDTIVRVQSSEDD